MDARGAFPFSPIKVIIYLFVHFLPVAPPQNPPQKAPEICVLYALDVPASAVRAVIRQRFERNRHLSDPNLIDILLHKSRVEYQETMNFWKQESHVLGLLLTGNRERPHRTFMQKFFEGGLPICIWSVPGQLTTVAVQGEMRMLFFPRRPMCNIFYTRIDSFFSDFKLAVSMSVRLGKFRDRCLRCVPSQRVEVKGCTEWQ